MTKSGAIYARNPGMAPHYIANGATVKDSLITEGCEVYGTVDHSVLFAGVNRGGRRQRDGTALSCPVR